MHPELENVRILYHGRCLSLWFEMIAEFSSTVVGGDWFVAILAQAVVDLKINNYLKLSPEVVSLAAHRSTDRLLCCLIVGIHA